MAGVAGTAQRSGTDRRQTGHIHLLRRHGKRHHLRPERRFSYQRAERLHRRHQSHARGNRRPGSIFKLVTAACAKDSELADTFQWDCTGTISVEGQLFRCHDDQGHGRQTMPLAMRNSCNPFFIQLSQQLSGAALRQTAKALGFGQEIPLTTGQVASSGTLPTLQQLQLPAERANFGFGQGILTATPLQITRMTWQGSRVRDFS